MSDPRVSWLQAFVTNALGPQFSTLDEPLAAELTQALDANVPKCFFFYGETVTEEIPIGACLFEACLF